MEDRAEFATIHSLRTRRRLHQDPVPDEVLRKVLDAGVYAPSGQNLPRWAFLIVNGPAD